MPPSSTFGSAGNRWASCRDDGLLSTETDLDLEGELRGVPVGLMIRLGLDRHDGVSFWTLDAISRVMKGLESRVLPEHVVIVRRSRLKLSDAKIR